MNFILIVAITSTLLASGTSSSMTSVLFKTQEACEYAGEQAVKKFPKQILASKVSYICVPEIK